MIGDRIRELRINKGLTLVELQEKSGVSYVQISRYEREISKPTSKVIKKIADALSVDTNVLIDKRNEVQEKDLSEQFKELMIFLRSSEDDKLALSKIFEAMLFKERIKCNIISKE